MLATAVKALTLAAVLTKGSADSSELAPDSLLKVLRQGGYTVVLRHARTDKTSQDEQGYSGTDRTTQRNLSGAGVADAKAIGRVMKANAITFSEVLASPMFRTMETAEMAFGKPVATPLLRDLKVTDAQRELLARRPAAGTNRALVTHHFVIEQLVPGIRPGDVDESEGVVIKTGSSGELQLVGRFKLADWQRLGGERPPAAVPPHGGGAAQEGNAFPSGKLRPTPESEAIALKPFDWQATAATRVIGRYLHSFNSGDTAQMRAFTEQFLVADPNRPIDARIAMYRTLFRDNGPMTPVGTERATETEAAVRVTSLKGEFTLVLTMSATDPTRGAFIRFEGRQ